MSDKAIEPIVMLINSFTSHAREEMDARWRSWKIDLEQQEFQLLDRS